MKKVRYLFTQLILGSIFISNTSFIKEQTEKTLIYIGDPMCSWCYGFAPEISEIQEKLPEDIGFELVVGGLRPYGTETMKELKGFLTHHWEDVSQRSGQPFRYDILDQSELLYDTEPACRAVVTMQTLKPEVDLDYFKTIQKGFYYHNFDPSQTSTYSTQATEFGIDAQKFTLLFESEEMKRKTKMQFGYARKIGANSFPTVLLEINGKHRVVTKGYDNAAEILKRVNRY